MARRSRRWGWLSVTDDVDDESARLNQRDGDLDVDVGALISLRGDLRRQTNSSRASITAAETTPPSPPAISPPPIGQVGDPTVAEAVQTPCGAFRRRSKPRSGSIGPLASIQRSCHHARSPNLNIG